MTSPEPTPSPQGGALRGTAVLGARQLAVSLLTVAAVGALSVLLSPGQFAIYGYAASITLVAAGIGDLGGGAALIRGEARTGDVGAMVSAQLLVWGPMALIGVGVVAATGAYHLTVAAAAALAVGFVALCVQTVPTALLERDLRFLTIAVIEVAQRALLLAVILALALTGLKTEAVPAGMVAAALAGCLAVAVATGTRLRATRPRLVARGDAFASAWWRGRVYSQANYAVYPVVGGLLLSAQDTGYVLWALAVTQVPALLAPMAARALLPSLVRSSGQDQIAAFGMTLRLLLLVSLPLVAAIAGCAVPLVDHILGAKWTGGVDVLRLECVTTTLGVALTAGVPVFYLVLSPAVVTRVLGAWTVIAWGGTPLAVVAGAGLLGPSLTVIVAAGLALIAFDRMLLRATGYCLLRDLAPPVAALVLATGAGLAASSYVADAFTTTALFIGVAMLQLAFAATFGLWRDLAAALSGLRAELRRRTTT